MVRARVPCLKTGDPPTAGIHGGFGGGSWDGAAAEGSGQGGGNH